MSGIIGYMQGKQIKYVCYFPPEMVDRLRKLKQKTDVPVSVYIRKGVDFILQKYEKK